MTRLERRETQLRRRRRAVANGDAEAHPHHVGFSENDPLPYTDASMHHHMSESRRHYQDAFRLRTLFPNDPASKVCWDGDPSVFQKLIILQDFIPKLQDHLLGRLLSWKFDGDDHQFTNAERNTVRIVDNRIYSAKVLRVNYTTYDVRRDQDSMNPSTERRDVMVLSPEEGPDAHPYWYARVLGVFHARVLHTGPQAVNRSVQRMEFLWVRWLGIMPGHKYGFKAARLPKIGFVPETDDQAFGFLDPSLVVRGCHLIPAFADGRTSELLATPHTAARLPGEIDDWAAYYVGMCVLCITVTD
jgi:hypothetical protein